METVSVPRPNWFSPEASQKLTTLLSNDKGWHYIRKVNSRYYFDDMMFHDDSIAMFEGKISEFVIKDSAISPLETPWADMAEAIEESAKTDTDT